MGNKNTKPQHFSFAQETDKICVQCIRKNKNDHTVRYLDATDNSPQIGCVTRRYICSNNHTFCMQISMDYHHYLCSTMTNKYAGEITKDINSTDDNDTDVEKHIKHFQEQIDKMQAMMEETKDNVDKLVATLDNQEKQSILDVDVLQHGEI